MDLKGSLIDTQLKIIPTQKLLQFLSNITVNHEAPENIKRLLNDNLIKDGKTITKHSRELTDNDNNIISEIKKTVATLTEFETKKESLSAVNDTAFNKETPDIDEASEVNKDKDNKKTSRTYLCVSDIDWLYTYIQEQKSKGTNDIPYLHEILEGISIQLPENEVIKRNPELEARCVKLRAQQEAREYRKMTKTVDNVRAHYPEETIAYQIKSMNRQLIAVGQFILSIFAGFLFGFRGIELMVGLLDFGFRLLLGVMCALVIALAEIYFLAKKLNEELNATETVQLGGPAKFAENKSKPHQD